MPPGPSELPGIRRWMYASWLAVFRPRYGGVVRMDARSLDVLAHDLPAQHMLGNDMRRALSIHMIIQGGCTSRTRQRSKPGAQRRRRLGAEDLSYQDVRPLRTSSEATLPHQLGVLSRTVRFQHRSKHVMQRGGAVPVATFRAQADHDLEAARHRLLRVTGARRRVNRQSRGRHGARIGRRYVALRRLPRTAYLRRRFSYNHRVDPAVLPILSCPRC